MTRELSLNDLLLTVVAVKSGRFDVDTCSSSMRETFVYHYSHDYGTDFSLKQLAPQILFETESGSLSGGNYRGGEASYSSSEQIDHVPDLLAATLDQVAPDLGYRDFLALLSAYQAGEREESGYYGNATFYAQKRLPILELHQKLTSLNAIAAVEENTLALQDEGQEGSWSWFLERATAGVLADDRRYGDAKKFGMVDEADWGEVLEGESQPAIFCRGLWRADEAHYAPRPLDIRNVTKLGNAYPRVTIDDVQGLLIPLRPLYLRQLASGLLPMPDLVPAADLQLSRPGSIP